MQVKLLHDLVEELAGLGAGRIVEILFNKKDVNEFLIAKKMDLTINQVRNILYKLSADGLVSFIRKKDKRKGWYIYYWTLKIEKSLVKLEDALVRRITELNNLLKNLETRRYYVCKTCDIEVGEEKALENDFSCEECAGVYELADNTQKIEETKAHIRRTERYLKLIRNELESIREKERRRRARAEKKAEKERLEKKRLQREARAAARKKNVKKGGKVEKKTAKKGEKKQIKKKGVKKAVKKIKSLIKKVSKKTSVKKTKEKSKK